MKNPKPSLNLFAIFFFLVLGVASLFSGVGIINLGIWGFLWRYWPLFIAMGLIQIAFRKSKRAGIIVASLGFGMIGAIIVFSSTLINQGFKDKLFNFLPIPDIQSRLPTYTGKRQVKRGILSQNSYPEVEKRLVSLNFGAGVFDIRDSNSQNLLDITSFYYENYGRPELKVGTDNKILNIDFATKESVLPLLGGAEDIKYISELGVPDIPTDIIINVRAGTLNFLFTQTNLDSLDISIDAGKATVELGENSLPKGKINISVGAGNLNLILPVKSYAKFTHNVGLGTLYVNSKNLKRKGVYTPPNFSIVEDPIEVIIKVGVGAVFVNTSGQY